MSFTRNQKLQAYLICFDNFSADSKEIAEVLHISTQEAFRLLTSMQQSLVCAELMVNGMAGQGITRKTAPGVAYTWQCYETYDSISRDEAIAKFDSVFPKE